MGGFTTIFVCCLALGWAEGQTLIPLADYTNVYNYIRDQAVACVGQFICEVVNLNSPARIQFTPPLNPILDKYNVNCVPYAKRCDGIKDCRAGQDEVACPSPDDKCRAMNMYTCGNKVTCGNLCNGVMDCPTGEDELMCSPGCKCPLGQFACSDNTTCLMPNMVCNGVNNCPDGGDEVGCATIKCSASYYRCAATNVCIPKAQLCDGTVQCTGGDDELHCVANVCPAGQYKCADNSCIAKNLLCNGATDCPDGDDEECCDHICGAGTFTCPGAPPKCIMKKHVCDGVNDCGGNQDETGCPIGCTCGPGNFLCPSNGRCIPFGALCDDVIDCPGGEDETIKWDDKFGCIALA